VQFSILDESLMIFLLLLWLIRLMNVALIAVTFSSDRRKYVADLDVDVQCFGD